MPSETELKLHLPDDAESHLPRTPLLEGIPARRVRLHAIYYDTADRLLQRHGMALRLRRSGRRWLQTLKCADTTARGGLSARPEWESPAKLLRGQPQLDFAALRKTPLFELLGQQHASLREVFHVRVERTLWNVDFRKSCIEVAMDRGRIEVERARRRVAAPVAELELELKDGRVEDLIAAALRLTGRGAAGLALVPMLSGKAERGYRLADGTQAPPTKASARGFVEGLRPEMSTGAALRVVISHGLNVLLANTEALREGHDPEYVHQARVAVRRMRSALRLVDRRHADFPESLADELRWLGRLLGNARDWDVLAGATLPELVAAGPPELQTELQELLRRAIVKRDEARTVAAAALGKVRYARLALWLQAWALGPAPEGKSLQQIAPKALAKAHDALFRTAQFFAALTSEQRHRVRILAKRLRYSLDVLSVALPPKPTERYIAALSDLQDVLGELNDIAEARSALGRLTDSRSWRAYADTWLAQRAEQRIQASEARLLALLRTPPPWER